MPNVVLPQRMLQKKFDYVFGKIDGDITRDHTTLQKIYAFSDKDCKLNDGTKNVFFPPSSILCIILLIVICILDYSLSKIIKPILRRLWCRSLSHEFKLIKVVVDPTKLCTVQKINIFAL